MGLVESIMYDCGGIREETGRTSHEIVEDGSWRLAHLYLQIRSFTSVDEEINPLKLFRDIYNEKYLVGLVSPMLE